MLLADILIWSKETAFPLFRSTFQTSPGVQLRRGHRRQVHGSDLHRSGQVRGVGVLRRVQQAGGADAIGGVHAGAENPSLFHSHGIPETISFMFFLKNMTLLSFTKVFLFFPSTS